MKPLISKTPELTRAGSVYPYTETMASALTFAPPFSDQSPIVLYKRVGGKMLVARGAAPIGVKDLRSDGVAVTLANHFKPRNHEQLRVTSEAVKLAKAGQSFIIQAPTGFGKTYVGTSLISQYGRSALIVVTKEDIKLQWLKALRDVCGLNAGQVGLIQGDKVAYSNFPVTIAMIQSIFRWNRYPQAVYDHFGFVLVDEVHRMGAEKFSEAAFQLSARVRVGMTATPERRDRRDIVFRRHLGDVEVTTKSIPLIPQVLLIQTRYVIHPNIPHKAGRIGAVTKAISRSERRNAYIVELIKSAHEKDRNIVIFSDLVDHLTTLASLLKKAGVSHRDIGFYVGGLTETDRDRAKRRPIVFATYKMASEATDVPWWDTCILATPKSDVVQIVGRILREYPDKKQPVVMDLIDGGSGVLTGFAKKRQRWYRSIGAKVFEAQ